jgi:putative hemolysin
MVEGVFRLADRRVGELMTHRQNVAWIDLNDPPERVQEILRQNSYWRYPVGEGDLDCQKGLVHVKGPLDEWLTGKPLDVHAVVKPAPIVPEFTNALSARETLRTSNSHLAFIINEHGGVEGIRNCHGHTRGDRRRCSYILSR